jgi:hypothetical protein
MNRRLAAIFPLVLGCILTANGCIYPGKAGSDLNGVPLSVENQLERGAPVYQQTCATSTCHGLQGEGIRSGNAFKVRPLLGEEFQLRHPNAQIIFDVVRSGDETNLRALTDQEIYNAIAFQLSLNQVRLEVPLAAANAFAAHGGAMSGGAQQGIFPPLENVVLRDTPLMFGTPLAAQNDRLRLQVDQITEASAVGNSRGAFLILVMLLSDLDDQPITVSPDHLTLANPDGELLMPQSIAVHSAIEKFHSQTIVPLHGTVGLVVFTLSGPTKFDRLVYDDEAGNRLILALKP